MTPALSHIFSHIWYLQQPNCRTRHKSFELRKTRCRRSLPYSLIELINICFNTHTHLCNISGHVRPKSVGKFYVLDSWTQSCKYDSITSTWCLNTRGLCLHLNRRNYWNFMTLVSHTPYVFHKGSGISGHVGVVSRGRLRLVLWLATVITICWHWKTVVVNLDIGQNAVHLRLAGNLHGIYWNVNVMWVHY